MDLEEEQTNNCVLQGAEIVELGHLECIHRISLAVRESRNKTKNTEQCLLVFPSIMVISAPRYGHANNSKWNYYCYN